MRPFLPFATLVTAVFLLGCQDATQPDEASKPQFSHGPPDNPGAPDDPGPPDNPGRPLAGGQIASAGSRHSCAVASDGKAYCWGNNFRGELGTGNHGRGFNTPQLVTGDLRWQSVQANDQHTCGLTTSGQMYCWGRNVEGQLGIGTIDLVLVPHPTPEPVDGGHRFQSLASLGPAAANFSCGVTTAGDMYCWGENIHGQLGNGTMTSVEPTPVLVSGNHRFAGPASMARHFTCGLTMAGDIFCWGFNDNGQLGTGAASGSYATPAVVMGGHTFESVAFMVAGSTRRGPCCAGAETLRDSSESA